MKTNNGRNSAPPTVFSAPFRWMLLTGCALTLLLGLLSVAHHSTEPVLHAPSADAASAEASTASAATESSRWFYRRTGAAPALTAEEIVARKLAQFTGSRRELAREMARRQGVSVPDQVERFFDALEAGHWEEIDRQLNALSQRRGRQDSPKSSEELDRVWPAVLDAYGVAQEVHEWPAQKLLDYGNAILDSLRPGMVYVGGTDEGRWIPELLNETSGSEPHIIVTQNALADGAYLEFINTLYGDRFAALTQEDSQQALQDYLEDAQRRIAHDEQFPNEPRQLQPGKVEVVDGKVHVNGPFAVMAINEKLLHALMGKNPDLKFAVQESLPLQSTYADALPLGPLMELGARDEQNAFTQERAAQSLDYWRNRAQQIFSDPEVTGSPEALKSYSHDTAAAANLLAAHNFTAEAEQAYRLGAQLWPASPESVGGLADLLMRGGRAGEALQLIADFNKNHPDQRKDLERISAMARAGC